MNDYVDDELVRQLMADGNIRKLPAMVSAEAEEYLRSNFPLNTKMTTWIVDWNSIPFKFLHWAEANDDETLTWIDEVPGDRSLLGLLYFNSEQPCLVGSLEFLIKHLDELVWKAPGNRLLFGVERKSDGGIVFKPRVIEFNGRGELRGSI